MNMTVAKCIKDTTFMTPIMKDSSVCDLFLEICSWMVNDLPPPLEKGQADIAMFILLLNVL